MSKAVSHIADAATLGVFNLSGAPKPPKPVTPVNPLDTGAGAAQLAAARAASVDAMQRRSLLGATVAGQGAAPAPGALGQKTLLGS